VKADDAESVGGYPGTKWGVPKAIVFHQVQVLRTASHRRVVVENSCSRLVFKE